MPEWQSIPRTEVYGMLLIQNCMGPREGYFSRCYLIAGFI